MSIIGIGVFATAVIGLLLVTWLPRIYVKRPWKDKQLSLSVDADLSSLFNMLTPDRIRNFMQALVTIVVLGASIFIIISHNAAGNDKHWAYGAAGTILGYWLKGAK